MKLQPSSLDDRIAAAFADGAKSTNFEPLIRDVEAAVDAAKLKAAAARDRALDPIIAAAEVAAARREMEDATFAFDRLSVAVKKLNARLIVVKAAEENARRQLAYEKVLAARDELAKELASVYPPLAAKLAELMSLIAANNREVAAINSKLPDGASRILEAELIARGIQGWVLNGITTPSIIDELRLPAFHHNVHAPYTWSNDAPQILRIRA